MDPFEPIAGVSIERYAEVSADIAVARGNPIKVGESLGRAGIAAEDWERAHAGWSVRLSDPVLGLPLAAPFEARYHAALDKLLGPAPDIRAEDFAAMLGEALAGGLPDMGQRRGINPLTWSRISYHSRAALAADPARLVACLALANRIAERRVAAGVVPPAASAAPPGGPFAAPPGAPKDRAFEKDASVAAKAVGKAVVSGFDAVGSALDSVGKSLMGMSVGDRVMVHWSDGNKYPGTVAQVGKNQYLVAMPDGSQHWIPEPFVKAI